MRVTCDIINDLLPLYVDEICSDSTKQAVEEHIKKCEKCRETLSGMRYGEPEPIPDKKEIAKTKKPFSKVKKRAIAWSCFSVVVLVSLMGIVTMKLMENGSLYKFFYPKSIGFVTLEEGMDTWQTVNFTIKNYTQGKEKEEVVGYFEYNTIFVDKKLVNSANSCGGIEIRILDENGDVVIEPTFIDNGKSISVENLEINTKYTVQCRNGSGEYWINLC